MRNKTLIIPAQLIKFDKLKDKSYKLVFDTTNEYRNDGGLDDFQHQPIWLSMSDAPLSQESVEVIQSTPIEPKQERFSASQKLRFAIIGLHKRLGSNTDPESFYQATIQEYINQLNKQGI